MRATEYYIVSQDIPQWHWTQTKVHPYLDLARRVLEIAFVLHAWLLDWHFLEDTTLAHAQSPVRTAFPSPICKRDCPHRTTVSVCQWL